MALNFDEAGDRFVVLIKPILVFLTLKPIVSLAAAAAAAIASRRVIHRSSTGAFVGRSSSFRWLL